MKNAELVHSTKAGGTVHKFSISGGKSEFTRYLASFLGNSKFCKDEQEALAYVQALEALHS